MGNMAKRYEINEKDIDSVIRFIKITDPKNATPEMAIELLEYMQAKFHMLQETNPEKLLELYNELKATKKTIN